MNQTTNDNHDIRHPYSSLGITETKADNPVMRRQLRLYGLQSGVMAVPNSHVTWRGSPHAKGQDDKCTTPVLLANRHCCKPTSYDSERQRGLLHTSG